MESNYEKCLCEKTDQVQESDESVSDSSSPSKEKKKISLTSLGFNLKRGHSLHFKTKRNKVSSESSSSSSSTSPSNTSSSKKSPKWGLGFNCIKKEPKVVASVESQNCCKCTCYRRTEEHHLGAGVVFESTGNEADSSNENSRTLCGNSRNNSQADVPEYFADAVRVETIENVQANKGIYGCTNNSMIAPFPEMSW